MLLPKRVQLRHRKSAIRLSKKKLATFCIIYVFFFFYFLNNWSHLICRKCCYIGSSLFYAGFHSFSLKWVNALFRTVSLLSLFAHDLFFIFERKRLLKRKAVNKGGLAECKMKKAFEKKFMFTLKKVCFIANLCLLYFICEMYWKT